MLYWKPTVTDNMAQEILSKMTDNMKRRGSMSKRLTKNYSKMIFMKFTITRGVGVGARE